MNDTEIPKPEPVDLEAEVKVLMDEQIVNMTDEEKSRRKTIEDVVEILQKAKIPFLLMGSVNSDLSKDGSGWWRYSRLAYGEDAKRDEILRVPALHTLYYTCLEFLSLAVPSYCIGIFKGESPVCLFDNGHYVPLAQGATIQKEEAKKPE